MKAQAAHPDQKGERSDPARQPTSSGPGRSETRGVRRSRGPRRDPQSRGIRAEPARRSRQGPRVKSGKIYWDEKNRVPVLEELDRGHVVWTRPEMKIAKPA